MGFSYKAKLFGGGAGGAGGSSLPDLTGNTGKVLTVNAGETGTEWAVGPAPAAAGSDTQVLFNDGGAIAGDAGLTFDKTTNGLSSTGPLTLTPAADIVPLTARAYSSGTGHIAQFQTSANGALSHIAHDGTFVGNVTGNVSGTSGSTTGNAATATAVASVVASKLVGRGSAAGDGASQDITVGSGLTMTGTTLSATGGGGITNSAGANVVTKSDGTNVVASTVTDNGTTLTSTGSGGVSLTNGSAGYKISVSGQPVVSLERDSSLGGPLLKMDATGVMSLTASTARLPSNGMLGFTVGTISQDLDTFFRRRAAANPAWGVAAASPVAYLHNFAADSRAGTDSNTRGANADLAPGNGTGTAGSGQMALQTAYNGATGTAADVFTDRVFLESVWTDLTESAATNFSKLTYAASTAVGAEWLVTISANDGTEYQSLTSRVRVSSVRKATGNTVSAVNVVGTDLTAASSGTLTATFTVVEGAAGVTLAANAVSSLTQTVLRISYQAQVNGPGTVGAP